MDINTRFSILTSGHAFLEAPRWHEERLWLSDFYAYQVITVDMKGHVEKMADVPQQPSGLGFLPDGRLLIVSMLDRKILRREANGDLVTHADLSRFATGHLNDMIVDAEGRAYVGNFGFDLMGGAPLQLAMLARVDPDGSVHEAARDLYFPNGSSISPDGKTLVVGETFGNRLSAFDVLANGDLSPRRDWAVFGELPTLSDVPSTLGQLQIAPDGTALDAEGSIWTADALGNRVLRVAPGGKVLETISTGQMGCYACALGGSDGHTLFLCVAPDFHEDARKKAHESAVWTTTVSVPGAKANGTYLL